MTTTDSQAVPRTDRREVIARAIHNELGAACDHRDELVRRWQCRAVADAVIEAEAASLVTAPDLDVETLARAIAKAGVSTPFGVFDPPLAEGAGGGQIDVAAHNAHKDRERGWFYTKVAEAAVEYERLRAAASPTAHSAPPDPPKGERIGSLTPEDRKGLGRGWRAGKGNRALRGD